MKLPGLRFRVALFALVSIAVLSTPATSAIRRVKWDSPKSGPGTTWATAYRTVTSAISASTAGDEVWVAGDSAHPYAGSITLKNGVALYGGFAGTEASRSERNWKTRVTILAGTKTTTVVTVPSVASAATAVDGFTIRSGQYGVYCSSSNCSPTLANNVFAENEKGIGGGTPTVLYNAFHKNDYGIYVSSEPVCVIANNTFTANRFGVFCDFQTNPVISNNTISGGEWGIYVGGASPTVANNIVAFNRFGVYRGSSDATLLRNNCVYNPGGADYYGGLTAPGDGDFSADPQFRSLKYGMLHIQPGSPCVDAGLDSAVQGDWTDMDSQARTQGTHVDIGADESDGTLWPQHVPAVVRVSPSGIDDPAHNGSTWALAKRTIQAGIDTAVAARGEVWVAAGTYVERVAAGPYSYVYGGFSGVESARSERDWRTNKTVIDGSGTGAGNVVTARLGYNVSVLDGFTLTKGQYGIYCDNASGLFANNRITGNPYGIFCTASYATIANNTVSGSETCAIRCEYGATTLTNNIVSGNKEGILFYSSGTISNNTIVGNKSGIYTNWSPPITNNIIAYNQTGIQRTGGTPVLTGNCVFNPLGVDYSGLSAGSGDISSDPLFHSYQYGRLHIQPNSPCVDAGVDSAAQEGSADMDGQPRIQGAHVDIGADESDGTHWPEPQPIVVRVSPSGVDDSEHDGSTWALAKRTVQSAIDAASAVGGEVWLSAGTYAEHVTLHPHCHVYGGFSGVETIREERNWQANKAILDGSGTGSVVSTRFGVGASTLDGVTVTNGTIGIYCWYSAPTICNNYVSCKERGISLLGSSPAITNNYISSKMGGGVECQFQSSPKITNNTLSGNRDGIVCTSLSAPIVSNNTIRDSWQYGIECNNSSPAISNNTISCNQMQGIRCTNGSLARVFNNVVITNGEGVHAESSSPILTNNTIAGSSYGVYCKASSPQVTNNIIAFNQKGVFQSGGSPVLSSNCVHNPGGTDYEGLTAGEGDISADPQFQSYVYGKLHIQQSSPCAESGMDSAVHSEWTDMDGQQRIQGTHVDIGADESDGTQWPQYQPVVVRVSTSGVDDAAHDGSTWALAKRSIQAGIDIATAVGGDVWVAAGTYSEQVTLHPHCSLYGGFAGSEADFSQRNWQINPTIIRGPGSGSVVSVKLGYQSTLDGFSLTNGDSGINCENSSPIIANNMISGNKSHGVRCSYSSAQLTSNTLEKNLVGISGTYSALAITNNTFVANSGAAMSFSHSPVTIAHNSITNNGAGINCESCDGASVSNNFLAGNSSYGVWCSDGPATGTIINNIITGSNYGIQCSRTSSPEIINNTISAVNVGIYCERSSSPAITNNILSYNGKGVYASASSPELTSNCVYNPAGVDYEGVTPGGGDISSDPLFECRAYGKLHVQPGSPCVDAGLDSEIQPGWSDMDGQQRVQGLHVDIGADESDGTIWPEYQPAVVRVTPNGADDAAHDGSSWELAKRTVQAGINAASAVGGEVWVMAGTYSELVTLKGYCYAYGGFSGVESARDQRDWQTNATIIDGGEAGNVVTFTSGFLVSTLDGFSVKNGEYGIYASKSSPILAHNNICDNEYGFYGSYSSPEISDSVINNNPHGVYCSNGSPSIVNCNISWSLEYGIHVELSRVMLSNNTISSNGEYGIYCSDSVVTIRNNTVHANGRGIYAGSMSTITNNTVTANGTGIVSNRTITANNIVAFNAIGIDGQDADTVCRNNCVYNPDGVDYRGAKPGAGDISADPMLQSSQYGKLHIQAASPCVNAGLDTAVTSDWTDMDGQGRLQGAHVDIGADESDGTEWPDHQPLIVRVSTTGVDDEAHDGSSWVLAKRTISAGMEVAAAVGGEVWVAGGTYVEQLILPAYCNVYGGFSGGETVRSERDWIANKTILEGAFVNYVVVAMHGYAASSLDGFTIKSGDFGIYCYYCSPSISNCNITANVHGGIYCLNSYARITNNELSGNAREGIFCYSSSAFISNNSLSGNGDGIHCYISQGPEIVDNKILGSTRSGIHCDNSDVTVRSNDLSHNEHGIFCERGSLSTVTSNTFSNNSDGIYCSTSSPVITDNTFSSNQYGVYCASSSSTPTIASNTFSANNYAMYCSYSSGVISDNVVMGGDYGIYCSAASPSITNNTVSGSGYGIYCYPSGSSPAIRNNVLAFNQTGIYRLGGSPVLSNNCVHNPTGANYSGITAGPGDIQSDPLFVNRDADDYHLQPTSPCINAGLNSAPGLPLLDFDGQGRIFGGRVDIGADEWWSANLSIPDVKGAPDGAIVSGDGSIVTAAWPDAFYIEAYSRASGIRVEKTAHGLAAGQRATISGKAATNADGEKFIAADSAIATGEGVIEPLVIRNRSLGGGDLTFDWLTVAGQKGVYGSLGLNNIGLLVTTSGVVYAPRTPSGWFYIDDGSGASDGSGTPGIYVDATGLVVPAMGQFATVTGISSCEWYKGKLVNVLRPRSQDDITAWSSSGDSPPPPPFLLTASPRQ